MVTDKPAATDGEGPVPIQNEALSTDDLAVYDRTSGTGVARELQLRRPAQRNALSTRLLAALHQALVASAADKAVRAIVLSGTGHGFCSGGDTKEFAGQTDATGSKHRSAALVEVLRMLRATPVPVIAAVQGAALGAGASLVFASDMAVAADDVVLGFPEAKRSIPPTLVLPQVVEQVGPKLAFELLATGRPIRADEALGLGLVNNVVARADLLNTALSLAHAASSLPRDDMASMKQLFHEILQLPPDAGMSRGLEATHSTMSALPRTCSASSCLTQADAVAGPNKLPAERPSKND